METKEVTTEEYARYHGVSVQYIRSLLFGKQRNDPDKRGIRNGVKGVKHYSRFYTLLVDEDLDIPEEKVLPAPKPIRKLPVFK